MKRALSNLKRFLFACIMAFPAVLMACSDGMGKPTDTFITKDSTLIFTFVGDSLYVDTYESGCGIEEYKLELKATNNKVWYYDAFTYVMNEDGETNHLQTYEVTLYQNPMGAHYEYIIQFDNEEKIPLIKVRNRP